MKVICNMILFGAFFYLPTYSVHAGNLNDDNNKERLKTTQLLDSYLNLKDIISEIIKKNDYKTHEREYKRALYTFAAEWCRAIRDSTIEELQKETDEISIFKRLIQSDIDIFTKNYRLMISIRREQGYTIPNDLKEMEDVVIFTFLSKW